MKIDKVLKKLLLLFVLFLSAGCQVKPESSSYFQLISSDNKLMNRIDDPQSVIDLFALLESADIEEQAIRSDYYIWLKYMKNDQVEVSYRVNMHMNMEKDGPQEIHLVFIDNQTSGKNNVLDKSQKEVISQFFELIEFDPITDYYQN